MLVAQIQTSEGFHHLAQNTQNHYVCILSPYNCWFKHFNSVIPSTFFSALPLCESNCHIRAVCTLLISFHPPDVLRLFPRSPSPPPPSISAASPHGHPSWTLILTSMWESSWFPTRLRHKTAAKGDFLRISRQQKLVWAQLPKSGSSQAQGLKSRADGNQVLNNIIEAGMKRRRYLQVKVVGSILHCLLEWVTQIQFPLLELLSTQDGLNVCRLRHNWPVHLLLYVLLWFGSL